MTETSPRTTSGGTRIGVLALQGDFREHVEALRRLGVTAVEVRTAAQLADLDGLIIPGGESTTITKLMADFGLTASIAEMARDGKAVWGTCAGMIVIARQAEGLPDGATLALMDVSVRRNAYGRQADSFEEDLPVPVLGESPFHCVFIRAPGILDTGAEVETLAALPDGTPVAVRQGRLLATAFHPELTRDGRFHALFAAMARTEDAARR